VHGIAAQVIGLIHIETGFRGTQITQALHGLKVPTVQEEGGSEEVERGDGKSVGV